MNRFNADDARIVANASKQKKTEEAIDKIYEHISPLIKQGYDGCVMWQHQYPDILLNWEVAEFFKSKGFNVTFNVEDLSLHISW